MKENDIKILCVHVLSIVGSAVFIIASAPRVAALTQFQAYHVPIQRPQIAMVFIDAPSRGPTLLPAERRCGLHPKESIALLDNEK